MLQVLSTYQRVGIQDVSDPGSEGKGRLKQWGVYQTDVISYRSDRHRQKFRDLCVYWFMRIIPPPWHNLILVLHPFFSF